MERKYTETNQPSVIEMVITIYEDLGNSAITSRLARKIKVCTNIQPRSAIAAVAANTASSNRSKT